MSPVSLVPAYIGSMASHALAQASKAQVWGATSRGVFLHLPSGWIIFLSAEPFRGPLTLNLCGREPRSDFPPALQAAALGTKVEIRAGVISFDSLDVKIQIEPASCWAAPPLPDAPAEQFERRFQRVEQLLAISHQLPAISYQLINNLGLGSGLTPAGDDVALGFLLAAHRWSGLLCPGLDLQSTSRAIQQAAYGKTSTLSANLIECAAQGQADERLILALDGIITGQPESDVCLSILSGWGSSSGMCALQGMALAIKTFNPQVNP